VWGPVLSGGHQGPPPVASRPDDTPSARAGTGVVGIGRGPRAAGVAPPLLSLSTGATSYAMVYLEWGMGKKSRARKTR
jgi:hypothetical protein